MARVHLRHGNDSNEPSRSLWGTINGLDAGDPHVRQLLPQGGAVSEGQAHMGISNGPTHCGRHKDRVVPVSDTVYLDKIPWVSSHT